MIGRTNAGFGGGGGGSAFSWMVITIPSGARVTCTTPSGSRISGSKDSDTSYIFKANKTGTYSFTATDGSKTATGTINVNALYSRFTLTLTFVFTPVYVVKGGVRQGDYTGLSVSTSGSATSATFDATYSYQGYNTPAVLLNAGYSSTATHTFNRITVPTGAKTLNVTALVLFNYSGTTTSTSSNPCFVRATNSTGTAIATTYINAQYAQNKTYTFNVSSYAGQTINLVVAERLTNGVQYGALTNIWFTG